VIARFRGGGGCLLCVVTVLAGVVAEADAGANERLARVAEELRAEDARLRGELARRDAELERMAAELAVLQRLVVGRSSERARPGPARGEDGGGAAGRGRGGGGDGRPRGPGPGRGGAITHICPGSR